MTHQILPYFAFIAATVGFIHAAEQPLRFEKSTVQLMLEPGESTAMVSFPFVNSGTSTVQIAKHASACSCIEAQFKDDKLSYAAGESGAVEATFKVGNFYGTVKKQIVVWLKDDAANKPSIVLTAEITIPELITITPRTLNWAIGSDNTPKSYRLEVTGKQPMAIEQVVSTNNHFAHEVKTIREGWEYEITVTPQDTKSPSFAIFKIVTDSPIPRFRRTQAFANLK